MFELAPSRKIILGLLSAALVSMLLASMMERLRGEPLIIKGETTSSTESDAANPMADLMSEIGRHMEELRENPNDYDMLVHTSDLLIQTEQWDAAESFLQRAIAIDATKAQPHYLLGMVFHSKEMHNEAAASLEKVVAINDDPSARYSLGVLYLYYLKDAKRGLEHLEKAMQAPNVTPELRSAIEEEIQKAKTPSEAKP